NYKDTRADLKRAQDQLNWIPQHRPAQTVAADIAAVKDQRLWQATSSCAEVSGKTTRDFCAQFHRLTAEEASAVQAEKLEARVAELNGKLSHVAGGTVMAEADPQASVLAKLTGLDIPTVQTVLTIFVALLIEIGSAFGIYVAFAYWRLGDDIRSNRAGEAEVTRSGRWREEDESPIASTAQAAVANPVAQPRVWAND